MDCLHYGEKTSVHQLQYDASNCSRTSSVMVYMLGILSSSKRTWVYIYIYGKIPNGFFVPLKGTSFVGSFKTKLDNWIPSRTALPKVCWRMKQAMVTSRNQLNSLWSRDPGWQILTNHIKAIYGGRVGVNVIIQVAYFVVMVNGKWTAFI